MPDEVVGFNIPAFHASLSRRGFLSPSKFMAYFPLPNGMLGRENTPAYTNVAREINMWCDGASIPGVFFQGPEIRHNGYGPTEKRPIAPVFSEVDLTFIVDAASGNWHLFRSWVNLKQNFDRAGSLYQSSNFAGSVGMAPYEIGFPEDYLTNVVVSQFSDDGTERLRVVLREAHPIAVGPMKLGWGDNKDLARFTATMAMTDWYHDFEGITNSVEGSPSRVFQPLE